MGLIRASSSIFAVVRGDMDLNEYKLANLLGQRDAAADGPFKFKELRPAQEAEIKAVGADPGLCLADRVEGEGEAAGDRG